MFNLIKLDWNHENVYSFSQDTDILNKNEHVQVIHEKNMFFDYDSFFDELYLKTKQGTVKTNHIFYFTINPDDIFKNILNLQQKRVN